MKVLVACEESQAVCKAFREKGHEAYSCDIQECSGGHPEWHVMEDVLHIIDGNCIFETQSGDVIGIDTEWDLIIAHPPCTYLTVTGNRWFNVSRYGEKALKREREREQAAEFFMKFVNAKCEKIAIENPVGYMNTHYRKADQIIQPWMFGDAAEKKTCIWLKGLPKLQPTDIVEPPARVEYESGKSMPQWYADAWHLSPKERAKLRSKTFKGIANAMAEQWG